MSYLTIMTGKLKGKQLSIPEKNLLFGRDAKADIRVNSTEVSRKHCQLRKEGEAVFVKDLGSRNGTFINGEAIFVETQIFPGDTLHVGNLVLEYSSGDKKRHSARDHLAAAASALKKEKPKGPTDDEVIDWLAESEQIASNETTIISDPEMAQLSLDDNSAHMPSVPKSITPTTQVNPVIRTIQFEPIQPGTPADKAARIIQHYWHTHSLEK